MIPQIDDTVIFHRKRYVITTTAEKLTVFKPVIPDPAKKGVTCATKDLIYDENLQAWYLDGRLF